MRVYPVKTNGNVVPAKKMLRVSVPLAQHGLKNRQRVRFPPPSKKMKLDFAWLYDILLRDSGWLRGSIYRERNPFFHTMTFLGTRLKRQDKGELRIEFLRVRVLDIRVKVSGAGFRVAFD